ncbi:Jag family protein [Nesterenkonia aerolata]|uniref:R3H domain-containing nucleic acid-binding protein n=1 Tax=Nesterenkonia aerolata TaxID=3074079 RepID=A0ABU2DTK6_9MICC|nr:R3H domain-containing nucleic acid-binding protein [Nesterenkonia sp. LY-0111]MDR8019731.1 R3H domain-containing nucleic acid-binding protein [Nesterenkonia sp. LY-0111]
MSETTKAVSEDNGSEETVETPDQLDYAEQHETAELSEQQAEESSGGSVVRDDSAQDGDEEPESDEGAEDEGDIAADYLEELLDIVDLDGDIDIEVRGDRTFISVVAEGSSDELDDLVGARGEVLDALQELTRLAVLTATGTRTRLVLDVAGHREQRQQQLKELADDALARVREHGEKVHLEPMSAYERKIVHDFIAEDGLISESEGEGKRRHIVVSAS